MRYMMLAVAVILAAMIAPAAGALQIRTDQVVLIDQDTTIDDDLLISAQEVTMSGTVNGDLIVFGGQISVPGKVMGNAMLAGQEIDCTGPIGGSVYAAGQTVRLGSTIARNVSLAGQMVELTAGDTVGRDAFLAGQSVDIGGLVKGAAAAAAASGVIKGAVGKTARMTVQSLTLTDSARIGGNLVYPAGARSSIAQGAKIAGQIIERPRPTPKPKAAPRHGFRMVWRIIALIWLLATAAIVTAILPKPIYAAAERIRSEWWWALLTGFVIVFVGVPVLVLLTLVLLPAGMIAGALWLVLIYLAQVAVAVFIGSSVFRAFARREVIRPVLAALAGVGIMFLVETIPVLGIVVAIAVAVFGAGALGLTIGQAVAATRRSRIEPTPPPAAA
jgi:cytoskeletal protein CcmA (bactofilin family)